MTTEEFIQANKEGDVSALALKIRQYPEVDTAFALQQIEGWQRARVKLPSLASINGWWWPKRISLEQCSSEETANYKARLITQLFHSHATKPQTMADLTGGFGIDTFYISSCFQEAHYVERQEELCQIAEHNFALSSKHVHIHNAEAETFLADMQPVDLLFLDPARRNASGGKVFRLTDCEPDLTILWASLMAKCQFLLLKLSPMLDITEALRQLPTAFAVHIVAVQNEVKEVLVLCKGDYNPSSTALSTTKTQPNNIHYSCVNIKQSVSKFVFSPQEELEAVAPIIENLPQGDFYLYEPNAAILKAGAYKLIATRYHLQKLADNSHLYCATNEICDFPGRIFHMHHANKDELKTVRQANILCRNYPLRPEELKKKLKTKDGGDIYIIGTRVKGKAVLLLGTRL